MLKLGEDVQRNGSLKTSSIYLLTMFITTVCPPYKLCRLPSVVENANLELSDDENDAPIILVVSGEFENYFKNVSCFVTI